MLTQDDVKSNVFPFKTDSKLFNLCFDEVCVQNAMKNIKSSFSIDPDGLCSFFLKRLSFSLCKPLSKIFKLSYQSSRLPKSWKQAIVVPLHKKGDLSKPSNFRPVSLCSIACKLMETIINSYVVEYLNRHELLLPNQYGFRKNKSCALQLLKCKNDWTNLLDKGKSVDVIYIDFCKAFDSVSHPKLLFKLEKYGINDKCLNWIKEFLTDRSQQVKVEDCLSDVQEVTSGVPQGSVLGPTLFLIFINDLLDLDIKSKIYLFADDVKLYNLSCNHNDLLTDLDLIYYWSEKWQLKMSLPKCFVLHLGRTNPKHCYKISDFELPKCSEMKDLGVYMSHNLSSTVHCNQIVKKARLVSNLIIKSFFSRKPEILMKAFLTYVRPILEYSCIVWNPLLKKDIFAVESVQRRFTKRILADKSLSYLERLKYFDISSLEKRRLVFDLSSTFSILIQKVLPPENFFVLNDNNTRTTHPFKLRMPKCRLNIKKFDFSTRVIKPWNNLPHEIVNSKTVDEFRKKIVNIDFTVYLQGPLL